jgi:ubiquitin carboxyl-terminal hydrolase 7
MIEPMREKVTLVAAEIQDGDIICFQKRIPDETYDPIYNLLHNPDLYYIVTDKVYRATQLRKQGKYADAKEFYDYLINRLVVTFLQKGADPDATFDLELGKKMTYEQFSGKVGSHLGVDPTHIRFWTVNSTTGNPKVAVRRNVAQTLTNILVPPYGSYGNNNQSSKEFYYEVLDLSLSDLENMKNQKLIWLSEGITKEEQLEILVPKNGTCADVLKVLQKKVKLDDATIDKVRLYETHSGKVYKELTLDYAVAGINDFVTLYAEKTPDDELNPGEDDRPIYAFHFQKEPNKPHGVPFKFVIKPVSVAMRNHWTKVLI